jgi:UDP-N-acetylmuramoylalanine--D-glutamate ligase
VITAKAFSGKHYAVLGLARSGRATVEALLASGAKVTAWDDKSERREETADAIHMASRDWDSCELAFENFTTGHLTQFDSIVVTPGLPLNRHPIAARAKAADVEIIGDIELFARARSDLPPHKVVGITGTNGKSTTTALVHHILQTAGVPSLMGGNIGLPILAQDPLPEGGVYVLELSSYQLDLTQSLDCDVAVLLNITPDHLDRYESFEAYAASKARLFGMQTEWHIAIIASQSEVTKLIEIQVADRPNGPILEATNEEHVWDQPAYPALQGPHNAENLAAAQWCCVSLGIDEPQIEHGLRTYPGLLHRMERIRERGGVLFVNDSKATNPTATAPALADFRRCAGFSAGRPSLTISTNARRISGMCARPIPSARRPACSNGC